MSYARLHAHFARIGQLEEVAAIVEWDQAVNMPPTAGPARAQAMAGLSTVTHELQSDSRVREWLEQAEGDASLDEWQRANLQLMKRQYQRATAVPQDLVYEQTEAGKVSEQAWRRYRAENDFASFAPFLDRVIRARRRAGEALGDALDLSPYEALMDEYEPGLRLDFVERAFSSLRDFLPTLRQEVMAKQATETVKGATGPFPIPAQQELGLRMMRACGLDMQRVRLDISHHPFCGGVPGDVRMTTRYQEADYTTALMGVLHESGHAKYEQGLPTSWLHLPVGRARGMISHESQSLLQEMQVCRGREFLAFLRPQLLEVFPTVAATQPEAFALENLVKQVTRVSPGLIRVSADEVTYPAHVLLRYELERDLIAGALRVADLPEAWDQKMQENLGLRTAGNDRDGCMQDVHWPAGAFGYFPLYTLGAMVAAQLFATAQVAIPALPEQLEQGDFTGLNAYLKEHIWSQGSRFDVEQLLHRATGEGLNPRFFEGHLRARYLPAP